LDAVERALAIAGDDPERIPFVVGPTASGKTDLAVRLAEKIGAEVVSVDSVQVYRGFDIGSGKPSTDELARAPHHLVGVLDPLDPIDAARFAEMATAAITDIRARNKRVVVCGGTFLWAKALLFGLAEAPPANAAIRARHRAIVEERGRAALHEELARVDRAGAAKLHPNDVVRVSRALEVLELSGTPIGEWQRAHAFSRARYDARFIALKRGAEELSTRIEARVRAMLEAGWIAEVEGLVARGYGEARAMGAVGYREVHAHLGGAIPRPELARAIVRSTRTFARRQRTWLNHEPVEWVEPDS
jgi:tRNA dimethylallyltransferase